MATSIHAPALLLPSSAASPSPPAAPALPPISSLPDYESDSDSDPESDNDISYLDLPASSPPASADPRDAATPDRWIPRHPDLVRLTGRHPLNCEPPLPLLLRHGFLTPSPLHYVRNHGSVPAAPSSPALWLLHITGSVPRPSSLTAADLASAFRPRRLPVTLVCAGNRRREQNATRQSLGFNWGAGGVSTAVWTGARLRDVLRRCGVPSRPRRGMHVWFEGEEDLPGGGGSKYGTSLPLEVAMDPTADVILAYEMNGREIPPDHGYPVRLIAPGHIGGRMVKWLRRIVVAAEESPNHYHFKDNRVLPSHVDASHADAEGWWYKPEYIINELNVNSVITTPSHDEILPINSIASQSPYTLRGYAYSGGGRKVTRVEVTVDGGETWRLCELEHPERPTRYGKYWCWCFWSIHVEVLDLLGAQEIAVRAWDQSHNTQPEKLIWNVMGMMNNCWFRVKISVCRPARGQVGLAFEHPTVPGNDSGGWMIRQKQSPDAAPPLKKTLSTPFLPSSTPSPTLYSLSDVAGHSSRDSAWIIIHGEVYDCTSFLKDHPGGADSILINAGSDCTEEFDAIHSDKARKMLDKYRIGLLLSPDTPPASPATAPPLGVLTPRENIRVTLVSKSSLTHNVRLFRFALPASDRPLGLPVGKHLFISAKVDGKLCMRAYTPVSYADEVGHFDLAVKVYPDGAMSRYLDGLPPGSAVAAKGPVGHVEYRGRGEFLVDGERRFARRLALVAGGTGITPVYQVVRAALRDASDRTDMWLMFANRSEEDVFLRREIEGCVEDGAGRLRAWFMTGMLGEEALRDRVPPFVAGETLALVCGPPGMVAAVRAVMVKLGFDEDSVVAF